MRRSATELRRWDRNRRSPAPAPHPRALFRFLSLEIPAERVSLPDARQIAARSRPLHRYSFRNSTRSSPPLLHESIFGRAFQAADQVSYRAAERKSPEFLSAAPAARVIDAATTEQTTHEQKERKSHDRPPSKTRDKRRWEGLASGPNRRGELLPVRAFHILCLTSLILLVLCDVPLDWFQASVE